MDFKIRIGRGVEGNGTYIVPSNYRKVSRNHATIRWQDGRVAIKDNGSTNGTFVNGKRITEAEISVNDSVWLGGMGNDSSCFQLDLNKICASFPYVNPSLCNVQPSHFSESKKTRVDYSAEFEYVKQVYIDYRAKLSKLKQKAALRMQLPRVLLSLIPMAIGLIFMRQLGYIGMVVGTALSGVIGTLTMGRNSAQQEKMEEDIKDLERKYRKKYKCPKCGCLFDLRLHWKDLKEEGCPKCGAKFDD